MFPPESPRTNQMRSADEERSLHRSVQHRMHGVQRLAAVQQRITMFRESTVPEPRAGDRPNWVHRVRIAQSWASAPML